MERAEQYATSWTPEGRRKVGEGGKGRVMKGMGRRVKEEEKRRRERE